MIAHPQSVGDDGKRRIDGAAGGKKGTVHDIEIPDVVRAAVEIQDRSLRIRSETAGAVLVSDAFQGDGFLEVEFLRDIGMPAIHFL